jgi:HEAT repeat protein
MKYPSLLARLALAGLAVAAFGATAPGQTSQFLDRPLNKWKEELGGSHPPAVRRAAAFAIGKMGVNGALAVRDLLATLQDADPTVREAAAFALGDIGPTAFNEKAVPVLLDVLENDKDAKVRRSAAYALGKYGPVAGPAAAALRKAAEAPEVALRQNAAWALGRLEVATGADSVARLNALLEHDADALVRRDAANALGNVSQKVRAAQDTPRPDVDPAELERLAKATRTSVQPLLNSFRSDKNVVVRHTALDALVSVVSPDDAAAAPDIAKSLADPDPDVVRSAALALANIGGPESRKAVLTLKGMLGSDDPLSRKIATGALASIGPDAVDAVVELAKALSDPDAEVRRSAAVTLSRVGPAARDAVPELIKHLNAREEEEVRFFSAQALGRIAPDDAAVAAALVKMLKESDSVRVRHGAVTALAQFKDFEQEGVVPGFATVLGDDRAESRILRYETATVLAFKLKERVPNKVIDVLKEALADDKIRIITGVSAKVSSGGTEVRTGGASVKETSAGDGRSEVAKGFGMIGKKAAQPTILDGLERLATQSEDPTARKTAAEVLVFLGRVTDDPGARKIAGDAVERLSKLSTDPGVQAVAKDGLPKLKP